MKILLIIAFIAFITATYPYWSYKSWSERMDENAKHPDFIPFSGKKFYG